MHEYFSELFQSTNPNERAINEVILQPFTYNEVITTLSSMFPLKSPGPDGFPVLFYNEYWDIQSSILSA